MLSIRSRVEQPGAERLAVHSSVEQLLHLAAELARHRASGQPREPADDDRGPRRTPLAESRFALARSGTARGRTSRRGPASPGRALGVLRRALEGAVQLRERG